MIQARTKGNQVQSDRADAGAASLAPILTRLRAGGVTWADYRALARRPSAFDKLRPSTPPDLSAESDDQHLRRGRADHQAANLCAVLWASTSI